MARTHTLTHTHKHRDALSPVHHLIRKGEQGKISVGDTLGIYANVPPSDLRIFVFEPLDAESDEDGYASIYFLFAN